MSDVSVAIADFGDIEYVARNMRSADVDELWALSRSGPLSSLYTAQRLSNVTYAAHFEDRPVAIFGAMTTTIGNIAHPWMLGTDVISRHPRKLLAMSEKFIAHLLEKHTLLRNRVHADHGASVRYLQALGFTLGEPYRTSTGAMAREFTMRKDA